MNYLSLFLRSKLCLYLYFKCKIFVQNGKSTLFKSQISLFRLLSSSVSPAVCHPIMADKAWSHSVRKANYVNIIQYFYSNFCPPRLLISHIWLNKPGSGRKFRPDFFFSSSQIRFRPDLKILAPVHP